MKVMNIDFLRNKTVLVTGGTGSFGKHFVKHLLANTKAKKVIVFSRDELKQFQMEAEISDPRIRFFIGDVRDLPRLERAFEGVDVVVHAAALKQVPALEYNPFEAVKTNVLGSQNVIEAALNKGVTQALLISTDKAAMPVNLYGATKLTAEKLFVAGNAYGGGRTKFSAVRYGNVVGSRGSIIEHLIKNKNAHTVHITDERMTRFWIDLDQAIDLVLYALREMEGGEIFVPKVPVMKISDLFDLLVPKAKREVIGIRPGEKVHELLLTREESRHALDIGDYFVVLPEQATESGNRRLKKFHKKGKKLPTDFHFASNENSEPMTRAALVKIVEKMDKSMP